jgi:hypothetical protein
MAFQAFYWATSEWSAYDIEEAQREFLLREGVVY